MEPNTNPTPDNQPNPVAAGAAPNPAPAVTPITPAAPTPEDIAAADAATVAPAVDATAPINAENAEQILASEPAPVEPVAPVAPAEPVVPVEPVVAAEPVTPATPVEATPVAPAEPVIPAPAEPVVSATPTMPAEAVAPVTNETVNNTVINNTTVAPEPTYEPANNSAATVTPTPYFDPIAANINGQSGNPADNQPIIIDQGKKKSIVPILAVIIALIVVVGGGVGAYFLLNNNKKKDNQQQGNTPTPTVVVAGCDKAPTKLSAEEVQALAGENTEEGDLSDMEESIESGKATVYKADVSGGTLCLEDWGIEIKTPSTISSLTYVIAKEDEEEMLEVIAATYNGEEINAWEVYTGLAYNMLYRTKNSTISALNGMNDDSDEEEAEEGDTTEDAEEETNCIDSDLTNCGSTTETEDEPEEETSAIVFTDSEGYNYIDASALLTFVTAMLALTDDTQVTEEFFAQQMAIQAIFNTAENYTQL